VLNGEQDSGHPRFRRLSLVCTAIEFERSIISIANAQLDEGSGCATLGALLTSPSAARGARACARIIGRIKDQR